MQGDLRLVFHGRKRLATALSGLALIAGVAGTILEAGFQAP